MTAFFDRPSTRVITIRQADLDELIYHVTAYETANADPAGEANEAAQALADLVVTMFGPLRERTERRQR